MGMLRRLFSMFSSRTHSTHHTTGTTHRRGGLFSMVRRLFR